MLVSNYDYILESVWLSWLHPYCTGDEGSIDCDKDDLPYYIHRTESTQNNASARPLGTYINIYNK